MMPTFDTIPAYLIHLAQWQHESWERQGRPVDFKLTVGSVQLDRATGLVEVTVIAGADQFVAAVPAEALILSQADRDLALVQAMVGLHELRQDRVPPRIH